MRPVCLQLKGFTSFKEDTSVSFAHLDRFAVCGPTGAGKSSLFDAMTFALFANAPRIDSGKLADLVSLGRKSFAVSLDFSVAGRTYRVMRTRSKSGGDPPDQLLELGNVEPLAVNARPVTAAVEKLLGLTYGHFTQSVFLPQGKFAELLRSPPSVRRKLLNELLRLLVYEKMREAAGQEQKGNTVRKEETQRRLREDFSGVSAQVKDELAQQLTAQRQILADADRQLPELRLRWEEARCNNEWTMELDAKQLDLSRHSARQAEIDQAQSELETSDRAAEVVRLCLQADALRKTCTERQALLTDAGKVRDRWQAEYEQATAAHARASKEAAPLPEMRERLNRLTLAVGKLPLYEKFLQEIKQHEARRDLLKDQRSKCAGSLQQKTEAISDLERTLNQAEAALAQIGYDQDRHRRLAAVRDDAFRLRSERERLITALRQAEQDEARAEQAEHAVAQAEEGEAGARKVRQSAQRKLEEAERRLRAVEDAHKAVHLRAALQPGLPCPVCLHKVGKLPADEPVPELEERQNDLDEARDRLSIADTTVAKQSVTLSTARAVVTATSQQAQTSRASATSRQIAVDQQQQLLLDKVGDLIAGQTAPVSSSVGQAMPSFLAWTGETAPSAPKERRKTPAGPHRKIAKEQTVSAVVEQEIGRIEESVLTCLQRSTLLEEDHRRSAQRATELRNSLVLQRKELETLQAESVRLNEDLEKTDQQLTRDKEALAQTQAEIQHAAGTNDPVSEAARVRQEIDRLQHLLTKAEQTETEANKNWQIAEAKAAACTKELATARAAADDVDGQASQAMAQAGFADAAAAHRAFRQPQQQQVLRDHIAEHSAGLHSLSARIDELEKSLQGRRVSREECRQCEQAHNDCLQTQQQAKVQVALLASQVENMGQQLERSQQLQGELVRQERQQSIFEQLAKDLRSDYFQAFLLEETLAGLVRDASSQLLRLTGDRYGLHFEDERIFVVDNDNAAEHRGIETLSGGETFLASLALALALSEQVQKIAGAVHLDCLFIDEGFGTLDPETLRTVSDTIRALQVGGRMVGVITHVPELKEEFDQRLIVERKEGTSRVRMEIC